MPRWPLDRVGHLCTVRNLILPPAFPGLVFQTTGDIRSKKRR